MLEMVEIKVRVSQDKNLVYMTLVNWWLFPSFLSFLVFYRNNPGSSTMLQWTLVWVSGTQTRQKRGRIFTFFIYYVRWNGVIRNIHCLKGILLILQQLYNNIYIYNDGVKYKYNKCPMECTRHICHTLVQVSSVWHGYLIYFDESM